MKPVSVWFSVSLKDQHATKANEIKNKKVTKLCHETLTSYLVTNSPA